VALASGWPTAEAGPCTLLQLESRTENDLSSEFLEHGSRHPFIMKAKPHTCTLSIGISFLDLGRLALGRGSTTSKSAFIVCFGAA
jgi:hypothetical protein